MKIALLPLSAAFVLTGCPEVPCDDTDGVCDTGETDATTDTDGDDTDGQDTEDTDDTDVVETTAEITLTGGGVDITATHETAVGLWLGLAQTGTKTGWFGEDCLDDNGCAYFTGLSGSLDEVETIGELVDGETTLFNSDDQNTLTYLVQFDLGDKTQECYVFGDDVSYYADEGCTETDWVEIVE